MSLDVTGFSHAGIRVHELDRSLAFYELLGFRKTMGPFPNEPVAILEHPSGVELNLIINAAHEGEPNVLMDVPTKHAGITHFALWVRSVDEARAALEAAGLAITEEATFPTGVRAIFVRDPDGNVVELDEPASP